MTGVVGDSEGGAIDQRSQSGTLEMKVSGGGRVERCLGEIRRDEGGICWDVVCHAILP